MQCARAEPAPIGEHKTRTESAAETKKDEQETSHPHQVFILLSYPLNYDVILKSILQTQFIL